MELTVTTQRMSLGPTLLIEDRTNQFLLNATGHDMAAFFPTIQDVLLHYGNQLRDNGLLGPQDAVLLI